MKKKLKRVGICLLGIILSAVLLSIFVEIDVRFSDVTDGPFARSVKTVWWFDWIYNPVIVLVVSLVVSFLDRSKYRVLFSLIAIFPFLVFYAAASSFSILGFIFLFSYALLGVLVSLIIRSHKEIEMD